MGQITFDVDEQAGTVTDVRDVAGEQRVRASLLRALTRRRRPSFRPLQRSRRPATCCKWSRTRFGWP
jgi:hypothetical protein